MSSLRKSVNIPLGEFELQTDKGLPVMPTPPTFVESPCHVVPASCGRVLTVERLETIDPALLSHAIDFPLAGSPLNGHVFELQGWALARNGTFKGIAILEEEVEVRLIPFNMPRPDVLAAFPRAGKQVCGFHTHLAVLANNRAVEYTVAARTHDVRNVPLYKINFNTGSLQGAEHVLQPLMVTTLGRSGSTHLMGVLSRHPEIAAYDPYQYEARIARYWIDVFSSLAQPGSFLQSIVPTNIADKSWWLGEGEVVAGAQLPQADVFTHLAGPSIDSLAALCMMRIDSLYRYLAARAGKRQPLLFAEKCVPDRAAAIMRSLYPNAREIVLVRDLRDMICSIFAFNRKRGFLSFGRECVATDADYMQYLVPGVRQLVRAAQQSSLVVQYENFIRDTTGVVRTILQHAGLTHDEKILIEMIAPAPDGVVSLHTTSQDAGRSIGRWRQDLAPDVRAAFLEHLDQLNIALGYDPTPA